MTTNSSAIKALEAINISIHDIEGNVRPVSEIIDELAGKWDKLSDGERQMTAVRVAGTQQLTRFSALMNNYKMGVDATSASINSQNSALNEQEKYNQSLEARLNRLKTAVWSLADGASNGILYDGIVTVTSLLEKFVGTAENGTRELNILPTVFGIVGVSALLLSTRVRGLTTSIITNMTATKASIVADGLKATALRTLATAAATAGTALKSLGLVLGVSMAAGYAIEFLIKKYSEATQKQEEMRLAQEKNIKALTDNKSRVEELISSYTNLEKLNSNDKLDSKGMEKYLQVQQELGELFPSLISDIDTAGQYHLASSDAIAKEVYMTNELIKAKKEEQQITAYSTIQDTLSDIAKTEKEINKLESSISVLQKNIKRGQNGNVLFGDTRSQTETLARTKTELRSLQLEASRSSQVIAGKVNEISEAFRDIEVDPNLKKELDELIHSLDFSKMNTGELESFAIGLANVTTGLQKAYASGDGDKFNSLNSELNTLLSTTTAFVPKADKLQIEFEDIAKAADKSQVSLSAVDETMVDTSMSVGDLANKVAKLADSVYELKSVEEQLVGVSNNHVQSSNELLFMYESLTYQLNGLSDSELQALLKKKELTAEEKILVQAMQQRGDVITQLSVLYPQFATLQENQISLSLQQIEAMKQEEKANKVLLESYKLAAEGKYTAEQEMTLAQALATKARIENIKKEIEALNILNQELQKYINNDLTAKDDNVDGKGKASMRASMLQENNLSSIDTRASELSGLQSELSSSIEGLGKINTKIGESSSKASKSSATTTKESIYLSDKFKQSLEAVNLEIEKQQAIQNKHPKHSEAYRKSLEAQLKLENEKLRLIQEQSAALDKQIKAGKIAQTGSVTIGDGNSKSTTNKSKKLSGWEGLITDTYGTYRAIRNGRMHTGVDLAGDTGTRLDSNVAGKVTQTGKNALSGNFVKIKDDKGLTHFYGHLDKIIAKVGDIVEAGSHIGNIGNTGNSSGSHLHYQINKANGNSFDPMEYVKAAKGMVVSSQQISSVVSNTTQSIDDAKSTLVGLQGDALAQIQKIAEIEKAIIESQLASFDFKRSGYDEIIGFEQAKLKNVTVGTTQYNKTMEKQSTLLKAKQKVNNDELAYVEGLIKTGNLSAITLEEMKARTLELKTAMQLLNSEIGNLALDKIMDAHGAYTEKQDDVIAYEKNKIEELDKNSARYGATLEKLNTHMNRKIITHQDTIKSIENEIKVLGLQGEALKRAKDEIQNLTLEMQSFKQEMSDNNYEIIVNIKTRYDEEIDDVQFEIDRSKAIQALYKEGSADASNEIQKQIAWSEKLVEAHDKSRKALQAELNSRDILPERIKEVTELMEDETNAYWNAKRAVEELNESLEETRKKLLNDIADKFISVLKNIYEEQRDMALDAIDDEMEAHEKAHEARIKQLNEEMDLFRKNVEEKLRLLDRQDAERSYNMEIDEMETERDKIVDNINLLSLDDSHEAKSKRKKLLEQLDKLDKDIAEKRYQRDLELQKQGLNDLLEDKEEEVAIVEESYEKQSQATLDTLREQREYWDQYYNDLLNDERKFTQIREDILNGHFDKVVNEFQAHMAEMIATMPQLANTMNGTMEAVGTAIRQNVIDEIQRAIDALREFQDMQVATNLHVDDFNPNASKDTTYQGNTGSKPTNTTPSPPSTNNNSNSNDSSNKGQVYASLNKGDLQVLLGKFINDAVAPDFKAETKERIALKAEGERIAGLGRANSSQIPVNSAFNNEMGKLTSSQIEQLKSFIQSNSGSILGGNYTSAFNKNLASLHTGGMTKYNGTGNDGIGGKLAMLHPNEIVLNPLQSDEMLKSTSIIQNIMRMITPVISKLPTPSSIMNNSSSKGDLIINIDNVHNTNDRDAQHFVNQIGDALRTKGMW